MFQYEIDLSKFACSSTQAVASGTPKFAILTILIFPLYDPHVILMVAPINSLSRPTTLPLRPLSLKPLPSLKALL